MTDQTTTRPDWTSTNRMSNSGYHRGGKPTWWARIGSTSLSIPRQRGDEYLTIPCAIFDSVRPAAGEAPLFIEYGVGQKGSKDAIRGKIKINPKEA